MSKFTLQLQNIDGEIQKEKEIVISEDDTLIMYFPESMTLEQGHKLFEVINKGIEKGGLIGIPNTITFSLIKKDNVNREIYPAR